MEARAAVELYRQDKEPYARPGSPSHERSSGGFKDRLSPQPDELRAPAEDPARRQGGDGGGSPGAGFQGRGYGRSRGAGGARGGQGRGGDGTSAGRPGPGGGRGPQRARRGAGRRGRRRGGEGTSGGSPEPEGEWILQRVGSGRGDGREPLRGTLLGAASIGRVGRTPQGRRSLDRCRELRRFRGRGEQGGAGAGKSESGSL